MTLFVGAGSQHEFSLDWDGVVEFVGTFVVLLAALVTAGWPAVGLTLGLAYGPQFAPAVFNVVRSGTAAGASLATWIMAATEAAIWLVYGLVVADQALIIGGAGGTLMASVILARLSTREASGPQLVLLSGR